MLPKIKLIITNEYNSLTHFYIKELTSTKFDIDTHINTISHLDPATDILLWELPYLLTNKIQTFFEGGGRCVVNGLWENNLPPTTTEFLLQYKQNVIVLSAGKLELFNTISIPEWFWYNESLRSSHHYLNYNKYKPNNNKTKKFLMPMSKIRTHRTYLYDKLKSNLTDAVYSYVDLGISLPDTPELHNDRHFNPRWYDETYFSVVAETSCEGGLPFITEKTFKPISFYHPFLIVGQPGTLSYLQELGFVTFPELFDESYDNEPSMVKRIDMVVDQINRFDSTLMSLPIVQEKLKHNQNHFFNIPFVIQQIDNKLLTTLYNLLSK